MVEGAPLLRECTRDSTEGSNPFLSATPSFEITIATIQGRTLMGQDPGRPGAFIAPNPPARRLKIIISWFGAGVRRRVCA